MTSGGAALFNVAEAAKAFGDLFVGRGRFELGKFLFDDVYDEVVRRGITGQGGYFLDAVKRGSSILILANRSS